MNIRYTVEKNVQILISLLKQHNIKKIIVSPGSTNITFVASIQQDSYFELYSSIDERSAAYMACGLSAESGEPVAISCTGATASRNYMPGLTEAYYRHLPILAITSTQPRERVNQNIPQVVDRSTIPNDVATTSVYIETIYSEEKEWAASVLINKALIDLRRNGGAPVHIDIETLYNPDFSQKELPRANKIDYYTNSCDFPKIHEESVAIVIGQHNKFDASLLDAMEKFCEKYNGVVLCDHTSNYWGKYKVLPNIIGIQRGNKSSCLKMDLLIHIGEMSGAYMQLFPKKVWRVHPDGKVKDTFRHLKCVFGMDEIDFFEGYNKLSSLHKTDNYEEWNRETDLAVQKLPELPFSNAWIAKASAKLIPENSAIHFGILNSLRTWNYFQITNDTMAYCNTGGFGIDGPLSSLIGASLADEKKLFFGVLGDLAFYYDMNSLGNRHVKNNLRIMIINNGKGNEFRNYGMWCSHLGGYQDDFICAANHFIGEGTSTIKAYVEALGYEYLYASSKGEYLEAAKTFFDNSARKRSIVFEVRTQTNDESDALEIIMNVNGGIPVAAKDTVKNMLGEKGVHIVKRMLNKRNEY